MQYQAISDKYTKARGDFSQLYRIRCNKCKHDVALYQKDGPGPLLRLYQDKILAPKEIAKNKDLKCPSCKRILASYIIYEKENRPAYRLFVGAIRKYKSDGIFPKEN